MSDAKPLDPYEPAQETARKVGRSLSNVIRWCRFGCPYLHNWTKPTHEWRPSSLEPRGNLKLGAQECLWILRTSRKAIADGIRSGHYAAIERGGFTWLPPAVAAKRIGCAVVTLTGWSDGRYPVPGGGELKFIPWKDQRFYREDQVDAIVAAGGKNPPSGAASRARPRVTNAGLGLPTAEVAKLCGVSHSYVNNWGIGRKRWPRSQNATPNGLPFRRAAEKKKVAKRGEPNTWLAADAVAIARYYGRPIPPDLDKLFPLTIPTNGNGHAPGVTSHLAGVTSHPRTAEKSPAPKRGRGNPGVKTSEALSRIELVEAYKADNRRRSREDFCDDEGIDVSTLETARDWYDKQSPDRLAFFRSIRR